MKKHLNGALALSMALTPLNSLSVLADDQTSIVEETPDNTVKENGTAAEEPFETIPADDEELAEEELEEEIIEVPAAAAAEEEETGALQYICNQSTMTASVYGADSSATKIIIPETVVGIDGKTYTVTEIKDNAFQFYSKLKQITIPNTVKVIGESAFAECSVLENIEIPSSVTTIKLNAFYHCDAFTDITVPASVTSLGDFVFMSCPSLKSVTILGPIKSIGKQAFQYCYILESVKLPDTVTSIGDNAFYCCAISQFQFPSSLTAIGMYAFSSCKNLNSIALPNTVTSIGSYAFSSCSGLTDVTIPASVTSISDGTFQSCTGLTNVSIPSSVTSIGASAFASCTSLSSIAIPSSVTSIGASAFASCSSLSSIAIPATVTSISKGTFQSCTGLTNVSIPSSVTSIGASAFESCTALSNIAIPNSVTSIGNQAFKGCTSLNHLILPDSVTSLGTYALRGCTNLKDVYYSSALTSIPTETNTYNAEKLPDSLISGTARTSGTVLLPINNTAYSLSFGVKPSTIVGWTELENLPSSVQSYIASNNVAYINNEDIVLDKDVYVVGDSAVIRSWPLASVEVNGQTLKDPVWIDGTITLTDLEAGTYTVTTSNQYDQTSTVSFEVYVPLELDTEEITIANGESAVIEANQDAVWTSSDESVVTVVDGEIIAVGPGTADIIVETEDGLFTVVCSVTVTQGVQGIELDKSELTMDIGSTDTLQASVVPDNATNQAVTWTSSDEDVAEVQDGEVIAHKAGTAVITVETEDGQYTASCKVTVVQPATGIRLDQTAAALKEKQTLTLKADVQPADATDKTVVWTSSDPDVAAVAQTGLVSAKKEGTTIITALTADGKYSAECILTVSNLIQAESISLNVNTLYLEKGKSQTLKASLLPVDTEVTDITWTSSNEKAASVDDAGKVTVTGAGKAVITARTVSGKTAQCIVYGYESQPVYRLYNPNSGEHFFTTDKSEYDSVRAAGWNDEGIAWTAVSYSDTPVYRLYNPNAGDHLFTTSEEERDAVIAAGWNDEGIAWYSDGNETSALHRLYNPNSAVGAHHYTISEKEKANLVSHGWRYEGDGWFAA